MKVLMIGVTGGTGLRTAKLLKSRGDDVSGLHRSPAQGPMLAASRIRGVLGDITTITDVELADAASGHDVLLFSAGASGEGDDSLTDRVDGAGVSKSIAAARQARIKRLILVSVFPEAWRERHMDEGFEHYIVVKKRADVELSRSDLDWVILRPAALTDDPGTGSVSLGPAGTHTKVTRDDVAETLAELVHTPTVRRRILEFSEGDTPIHEAVSAQVET